MSVSFKAAEAQPCIAPRMREETRAPPQEQRSAVSRQSLLIAGAVSLALAWSMVSGDVAKRLALPRVPYLGSGVATLSDLVVMVALAALAARRAPGWVLSLAGVADLRPRHFGWALLVFAPVVAAAAMTARLAPELDAQDFVWPGVLGPLTEELLYRGLAVGLLMRAAGWRLLPAVLWPAVFFGAAHMWQGSAPLETAGVVAITGAGGLLFGWLFVRWGYALWPAILLHIGMNCLWTAFDLGETAVGGWMGNGLRGATVILAIGLTLWLAPRRTHDG
jgi:uncharacterized protein